MKPFPVGNRNDNLLSSYPGDFRNGSLVAADRQMFQHFQANRYVELPVIKWQAVNVAATLFRLHMLERFSAAVDAHNSLKMSMLVTSAVAANAVTTTDIK
jgi:hypothetical protein